MKNCRVMCALFLLMSLAPLHASEEKIIIAHRGASGYLPEHTLASYAMAYGMGADYIEQDLSMTKDGVLICLHDLTLEATTNVEEVFADRKREDGKYYPVDFTLEEIKKLAVHERLPRRFPREALLFQVPTFEEAIQLVQGLNASTKRTVGIYPELKDPEFYEKAGLPFVKTTLDVLARYGYEGPDAKVYIQCFSPGMLKRLREEYKTSLPCIQLISDNAMLDGLGMDNIATYAQGIGPEKKCIEKDPGLVQRAHDAGLKVHPYTFRADFFSAKYGAVDEEMRLFLFEYGIDGGFTDQTDVMKRVIDAGK